MGFAQYTKPRMRVLFIRPGRLCGYQVSLPTHSYVLQRRSTEHEPPRFSPNQINNLRENILILFHVFQFFQFFSFFFLSFFSFFIFFPFFPFFPFFFFRLFNTKKSPPPLRLLPGGQVHRDRRTHRLGGAGWVELVFWGARVGVVFFQEKRWYLGVFRCFFYVFFLCFLWVLGVLVFWSSCFFFWGGQWLNRVFFRKKMVSRCF